MIEIKLNEATMTSVNKALGDLSDKTPKVLKSAINQTAKQARKDLSTQSQEAWTVKVSGFNKSMKIRNASEGNLQAIISTKGEVLALSKFKVRKNDGKYAAKAQVERLGNLKELSLGGADKNKNDLKAFVAVMSNGHRGIFQRSYKKRYMKGKEPRTLKNGRKTAGREAIKQFFSMSIPKMIGDENRVFNVVKPKIQGNLMQNIIKQTIKTLEGRA